MDWLSFLYGVLCCLCLIILLGLYTVYSIRVYLKKTGLKWGDKPVKYVHNGKK